MNRAFSQILRRQLSEKVRPKRKTFSEERFQQITRRFGYFTIASLIGLSVYLLLPEDQNNDKTILEKARLRYNNLFDFFADPPTPILLPPPQKIEGSNSTPITVVLGLNDSLINITWDSIHGYRVAKRPYLDDFLGLLATNFEVVLFTSQPEMNATPILQKLDPYNFLLPYRFTREHTRYHKGKLIKDLNYLGRDLNRVIYLDCHPEHYFLHKENGIKVEKWNVKEKDEVLKQLAEFLISMAIEDPDNIKEYLAKYPQDSKALIKQFKDEEAAELEVYKSNQSGLSKFLNKITNTEPALPKVHKRLLTVLQYQDRKLEIFQRAEQHHKEMEQLQRDLMKDKKLTLLDAMTGNQLTEEDLKKLNK